MYTNISRRLSQLLRYFDRNSDTPRPLYQVPYPSGELHGQVLATAAVADDSGRRVVWLRVVFHRLTLCLRAEISAVVGRFRGGQFAPRFGRPDGAADEGVEPVVVGSSRHQLPDVGCSQVPTSGPLFAPAGRRAVATGGAARWRSQPTRNPWAESWRPYCPEGATDLRRALDVV